MGRKRHRKAGWQGGGGPPSPATPSQPAAPWRPWWKGISIVGGLFLAAMTYFSSINAVRTIIDDTAPLIHVIAAEAATPFALPFTVENKSDWFDMRETSFDCVIREVRIGTNVISGDRIRMSSPVTIPRRTPATNFRCGIQIDKNTPIETISVAAVMNYKTLWFPRDPVIREFNYIDGRWVEGELH